MADLSKLSDADLEALAAGDMSRVSEQGLMMLAGEQPAAPSAGEQFLQDLQPAAEFAAQIPKSLVGAAETAGALATGAVVAPVVGLGGMLKQIATEVLNTGQYTSEESQRRIRQATEQAFQAGTYQPQTATGQVMTGAIGRVLQPVGEALLPLTPLAAEAILPTRAVAPRAAPRAAGMIPEAPAAAVVEEAIPEVVVSARRLREAPEPTTMAPPPAPPMTAAELTATTRTAAGEGVGAGRATRVLAEQASPDPKVVESATRLGILEYLQPDHLTTNQAYRELAQAIKSQPGSEARAAEITGLVQVGERADRLISEIGGTTDISQVSATVRNNLDTVVSDLETQSNAAYKTVGTNLPPRARGPATNVLTYIKERIADLDGAENLSPIEKEIYRKLSPKKVNGETVEPTYALLDTVRRDVGDATYGKGVFKDSSTGLAKRLYGLLSDDQLALADQYGQGDNLRAAQQLVKVRKALEDDLIALYGKQLDQSLVTKLTSATASLSKGDAQKLVRIMQSIPPDMRQYVAASALRTAFGRATTNGTLNFNSFANWYRGLLANKQAYTALMSNLPASARKALADLYRVSDNIAKASRERIVTGRIQAVEQELRNSDTLLGNVAAVAKRSGIGVPIEAVTSAIGMPGTGLASAVTSALMKDKTGPMKRADALIASPEFIELAIQANRTNGKVPRPTIRKVVASRAFQAFADSVEVPKSNAAREAFLLRLLQSTQQQPEQTEQ